jgi:hypothetical protein
MAGKYDKYIAHPPRRQIYAEDNGRTVFDGLWVNHKMFNYNFNMGHQFVKKPFKSNNPCHTHNFDEFLAWYSGNPLDPEDFGAEVVLYLGPELEKHVFTKPTIVFIPKGFPHCPLEITRVDRPIIQIEIMLAGEGQTREPYFEKDKGKKH